ncbi:MAG: DUF3078 domain-containing protein [Rubricoccaceae bacterium]
MRVLLVLAALGCAASASAQRLPGDTLGTDDGWFSRAIVRLSGSQTAFANWQEGGASALAVALAGEADFARVNGRLRQAHEFRASFGLLQQDTLAFRKADDRFRYGFALEHETGRALRPSVRVTAQSQFAPGFDYNPSPAAYPTLPVVPGERLRVSSFAAPAVLTQSVGATVRPGGDFVGRAGVGLKQTVVAVERLRPVHGNAPGQLVRLEAGLDAEAALDRRIAQGVRLRSRLAAFQAFTQVAQAAPDLVWENTLALRVNGLLSVNLDTVALYDRDVSARVQLREVLSVGLTMTLL